MRSAKKEKAVPPKGHPNDRGFFPIVDGLLGRIAGGGLNQYSRAIIKTMWAGRYKVIDIYRRFRMTNLKITRQAIYNCINREDLDEMHRGGRPRLRATIDTDGFPTKY